MNYEALPIRTDVPPSMHPEILSPLVDTMDVADTWGPPALAVAREALTAAYRLYGAIEDAEKALLGAAPTEGRRRLNGREDEFVEAATRAFERNSPVIDKRLAELKTYAGYFEAKLAKVVEYPEGRGTPGVAMATEIRTHLKSLKASERVGFLGRAVETGDRQTVAAFLSAPAFLSGADGKDQERVRAHAYEKWDPLTSGQLAAVRTMIDRVQAAGGKLFSRYAEALKLRNTPNAKASAKLSELAHI